MKEQGNLQLNFDRVPCANKFKVTCKCPLHPEHEKVVPSNVIDVPVIIEGLFPGDKYTCVVTEMKDTVELISSNVTVVLSEFFLINLLSKESEIWL